MSEDKQPPADDITLRDVMNHMNHKFDLIDARFEALEGKMNARFQTLERRMEQGFQEAKEERREILRRLEAEANAADDTMRRTHDLEKRVNRIEKQLAL